MDHSLQPGSMYKVLAGPDGNLQLLPLQEPLNQFDLSPTFTSPASFALEPSPREEEVPSFVIHEPTIMIITSPDGQVKQLEIQANSNVALHAYDVAHRKLPLIPLTLASPKKEASVHFRPDPMDYQPASTHIASNHTSGNQVAGNHLQGNQLQGNRWDNEHIQHIIQQVLNQMQKPDSNSPTGTSTLNGQNGHTNGLSKSSSMHSFEEFNFDHMNDQSADGAAKAAAAAVAAHKRGTALPARGGAVALRGRGRGGGRGGGRVGSFSSRQMEYDAPVQKKPRITPPQDDDAATPEETAPERTFPCPSCGEVYKSRSGLRYHIGAHHSQGTVSYNCHLCEKTYTSRKGLTYHLGTHSTS